MNEPAPPRPDPAGSDAAVATPRGSGAWRDYRPGAYDELVDADGRPRPAATAVYDHLAPCGPGELQALARRAATEIRNLGVTFTVYEDGEGIDRAWPFDVVPRVIARAEWDRTAAGLEQRLHALNLFIADVYGKQRILDAGLVPRDLIMGSTNYKAACAGTTPPLGVWAHICGTDLVRDGDGTLYVLEDNLRVPSGVAYLLENRLVAKRVFPEMFRNASIEPVDDYPSQLGALLASLSPRGDTATVVVLTPGVFNSAYFEHAFLAQALGAELAEGRDLVVDDDDIVHVRTVDGLERVDVIYRRIDDDFLDPETFRPDSALGVPGLIRAWRAGNVALVNAPGAGVADDKVLYAYVPDIIRYYLGEEPLVENVPTWRCDDATHRSHVLANIADLVVKPADASGGKGVLVGPHASRAELDAARDAIRADPRNWVAQPVLNLSTVPTVIDGNLAARHVDLRPFVLQGTKGWVTRGGLTRVALVEGSLVVNSSQGGGSKDTWIVDTPTRTGATSPSGATGAAENGPGGTEAP